MSSVDLFPADRFVRLYTHTLYPYALVRTVQSPRKRPLGSITVRKETLLPAVILSILLGSLESRMSLGKILTNTLLPRG